MQDITIKVKTEDLLARIQSNRDQHRAVFQKALEGFSCCLFAD